MDFGDVERTWWLWYVCIFFIMDFIAFLEHIILYVLGHLFIILSWYLFDSRGIADTIISFDSPKLSTQTPGYWKISGWIWEYSRQRGGRGRLIVWFENFKSLAKLFQGASRMGRPLQALNFTIWGIPDPEVRFVLFRFVRLRSIS